VFVDSLAFLPYALDRALQFREFLSKLPAEFACDVLSIGDDGKSFLSSVGRGDGRVLYALNYEDLEFYFQANSLTWPSVAGQELQPRQFAPA
jgi:hypothetical protein